MAVLYRKYRPQTFAEVVDQKYIVRTLKNQIIRGEIAHAYLFTGSRGVGKTSVARIFAKAVNCQQPKDGEPCGQCQVCQQVAQGNFLDLVEIDAASYTGVDNVRDIIEHVRFAPASGKYKIIIIDEVHMLSKPAFNALLKTLEEPPPHAIFILATTEIGKVLPTIISRTQRFDFKALSEADLERQIKKILAEENAELSEEVISLIAQNAEGSVRDALSLLGKVLTLGQQATVEECRQLLGITDITLCEDLIKMIEAGDSRGLPDYFDRLAENGQDFTVFNRDFLEYLRKILVAKITQAEELPGLGEGQGQAVVAFSKKFSVNELVYILRLFLKSYKEVQETANPEIPVLLAALEAALRRSVPASKPVDTTFGQAFTKLNKVEKTQKIQTADKETIKNTEFDQATVEEVSLYWPQVIESVRKINTPLANLVKSAVLLQVEGGRVVLGVKFKFHKQNLENQKNNGVIQQALKRVSGKNLGICAKVVTESSVEKTAEAAVGLADALQIFGGELIE